MPGGADQLHEARSNPRCHAHHMDRRARRAAEDMPGLTRLARWLTTLAAERARRIPARWGRLLLRVGLGRRLPREG